MEKVPAAFIAAVCALRNCCQNDPRKCACTKPDFGSSGWVFTTSSEKTKFDLYVVALRGQWMYGFRDAKLRNANLRTWNEVKNLPNVDEIRIQMISVIQADSHKYEATLQPLGSDFEELLRWVTSICNGPWLWIAAAVPFFCANGKILLEWIEQTWFYTVSFEEFNFVHGHLERFVEKQKTAWKSTLFVVRKIASGTIVLEKWLREGPVKEAVIQDQNYRCPLGVVKGFIKRFFQRPTAHNKGQFI